MFQGRLQVSTISATTLRQLRMLCTSIGRPVQDSAVGFARGATRGSSRCGQRGSPGSRSQCELPRRPCATSRSHLSGARPEYHMSESAVELRVGSVVHCPRWAPDEMGNTESWSATDFCGAFRGRMNPCRFIVGGCVPAPQRTTRRSCWKRVESCSSLTGGH